MKIACLTDVMLLLAATASCSGLDAAQKRPAPSPQVTAALARAGANKPELLRALNEIPAEQYEGMAFLIANMPDRDLKELKADFLLENTRLAYAAMNDVPWGKAMPKDVFLNHVLPYASVNERRDNWRKDFRTKFLPLIKDCKTPGQAGVRLNQKMFPLVKVRYSTKRKKPDQSPYESIESGLASCTGLSILLVDACRAVGVPARFAGTPLWTNKSGNHSWVEVWDQGWHYTGAAEPSGDRLDAAWFAGRASTAKRDDPQHAIYAVSFKKTPLSFPMVWAGGANYVSAVNVTDRYTAKRKPLAESEAELMIRVLDRAGGDRVAAKVTVFDAAGKQVFTGSTNDERFDANDHLTTRLPVNKTYRVRAAFLNRSVERAVKLTQKEHLLTVDVSKGKLSLPRS